jgi:hypothetical protein
VNRSARIGQAGAKSFSPISSRHFRPLTSSSIAKRSHGRDCWLISRLRLPANVKVSRIAVRDVTRQADQTVAQLDLAIFTKNSSTIRRNDLKMHEEGIFEAQIRNQNLQKGRGESGTEYELDVIYRPLAELSI